jgi:integrase
LDFESGASANSATPARGRELRDSSEPLFVVPGTWARQKKARPVDTGNATTRVFKKIEAKVGFEVNWHRLRGTYATITKTLGMDDEDRKDAMGHSSLAMTESYTDQTDRMRLFGNKIAKQLIGSEAVQSTPARIENDTL